MARYQNSIKFVNDEYEHSMQILRKNIDFQINRALFLLVPFDKDLVRARIVLIQRRLPPKKLSKEKALGTLGTQCSYLRRRVKRFLSKTYMRRSTTQRRKPSMSECKRVST